MAPCLISRVVVTGEQVDIYYALPFVDHPQIDQPQGPEKGERRVLRGSSWPYLHVDARCAVRLRLASDRWV